MQFLGKLTLSENYTTRHLNQNTVVRRIGLNLHYDIDAETCYEAIEGCT